VIPCPTSDVIRELVDLGAPGLVIFGCVVGSHEEEIDIARSVAVATRRRSKNGGVEWLFRPPAEGLVHAVKEAIPQACENEYSVGCEVITIQRVEKSGPATRFLLNNQPVFNEAAKCSPRSIDGSPRDPRNFTTAERVRRPGKHGDDRAFDTRKEYRVGARPIHVPNIAHVFYR